MPEARSASAIADCWHIWRLREPSGEHEKIKMALSALVDIKKRKWYHTLAMSNNARFVKCKCLSPRKAWICGSVCCKADGIVSPNIVYSSRTAYSYYYSLCRESLLKPAQYFHHWAIARMKENEIEMPCGKCAACQIKKRKDMSVRLAHEASQFDSCCFITLTYDNDNLPCTDTVHFSRKHIAVSEDVEVRYDGFRQKRIVRGQDFDHELPTLLPRDVQLFMKRLRRHLTYQPKRSRGCRDYVERIRYFAVGEYGSKTHRPHYHILIFGWKPSDADLLFLKNGRPVFRSAQIEKCWPLGFSSFSNVTPYVAKYCARYVTKKYARLNDKNDDWWSSLLGRAVCPEFTLQSVRQGGIGSTWFDKFGASACKVGLCCVRMGERISKCAIPKYYWNRLRKINQSLWLALRDDRIDFIKHHSCLGYKLADIERECSVRRLEDEYYANRETF